MTHTEQLRRALRAYDIAGPETPERANALAAAAALLGAVRQVDRAVRGSSETLRATAADYQTTEHDASELITRTIGNALGELR